MSQNPGSKLQSNGSDFTPTTHHDTYDFIKPEQFNLNGLAVFITGASKGIGRAASLSFAKAGASYIAIGARAKPSKIAEEIQEAAKVVGREAPQILALSIDVSDEDSVHRAAFEVEKEFGRLDVLCNNAGYAEPWLPIADSKPEEWWKVYDVNVRGLYLVTRAMLPLILKGRTKTILNTSSIGAHYLIPGASGYQTGKLAMLRFGEFINTEYGEHGVLSYAIHPGGIATELALSMPKSLHGYLIDTPELAGDSMVWLTAEKRDWLAGRYVSCNWDFSEMLQKREKIVQNDLLKIRLDVGLD